MTTLFITYQALLATAKPSLSLYNHPSHYRLQWRQRQLLVKRNNDRAPLHLPPLENPHWLSECLQRSPVQLVKLAANLSEAELEFWANACASAGKAAFLNVPNTNELPKKQQRFKWWLKRLFDWSAALLLLILLAPIMLVIAGLIGLQSPGPIFFSQWRVGERGRLFRLLKFRTMVVGAEQLHHQVMGCQPGLHKCENDPRVTAIGRWLRKFSLDELPQLINVLRGEMSLVGPRPWALFDALRLNPQVRHRLSGLPGITGTWQVLARSHLRDLDAATWIDLSYLSNWSIWQDFKILLMTIPKVLLGFGAY
ncbi:heterocyst development glycosyltransferase HepC [Pantanalinema sp. GBBB05]|uniref:heterocyst development glycosyltransferase HepC n=1 Tax=Pantanalinema sp. GBBB05 TaxID=2604139 RepID=UPI001DF3FAA8|nr:sugar transferase [Pantanalinema sp. GBBB05]